MDGIAVALAARAAEWRGQACDRELEQLRETGVGDPVKYARYLVPGLSHAG
jgi:hypothetical protein